MFAKDGLEIREPEVAEKYGNTACLVLETWCNRTHTVMSVLLIMRNVNKHWMIPVHVLFLWLGLIWRHRREYMIVFTGCVVIPMTRKSTLTHAFVYQRSSLMTRPQVWAWRTLGASSWCWSVASSSPCLWPSWSLYGRRAARRRLMRYAPIPALADPTDTPQ